MKTEKHLELIIPASLWPDANSREAIWRDVSLPSLAQLYGKGRKSQLSQTSVEDYLASLFGLNDFAIAPLMLQQYSAELEPGFWLCADPITLRVDRDHLTVLGEPYLQLSQNEADALVAALNQLYQPDGFHFIAPTPQRWFVRLPSNPQLEFTPFEKALGRNLNDVLPKGEGALKFNALLNEMQMLLYSHAVNDARDAAGQLLINSLWLWGGGEFSGLQCGVTSHDKLGRAVHGQHAVVQALSAAHAMPRQYSDLVTNNAVVVLDDLQLHAIYGAGYEWQQVWQSWESAWFTPALNALREGSLTSLTLTFTDVAEQITVRKSDLWRFWRRAILPTHEGVAHVAD
ncbi:hypothetical protein HQ393_04230 [Chitinibacter bivalviorum]|uniref:Phosphoglycerate mutase n=1 Tax=Chitinibacter bivalviorum TaxID=2739434 RepID=A0A7H9BHU9_9NEIS|nr:hypothetical protein [Chitinibacter bivalviorum]QLG87521.1 hypothetical protein HQ393_04230 [Chitinibacter bivalviorum]